MGETTQNDQAAADTEILTLIGERLVRLLEQAQSESSEYLDARRAGVELARLRETVSSFANTLLRWANVRDGVAEVIAELKHPNPQRFQVGDLVQLKSEYVAHGNPSLFRIREIVAREAVLGQLSSTEEGFVGADTLVDLDDPELIAPYPEVLQRYARHIR